MNEAEIEAELQRLQAFEKRILAFRDELKEDADEDGAIYRYMLYGDDADVVERFDEAIEGPSEPTNSDAGVSKE